MASPLARSPMMPSTSCLAAIQTSGSDSAGTSSIAGVAIRYDAAPSAPASLAGHLFAGTAGNDQIHGTAGDDTIQGGPGDDQLNAGLGDDTYQFNRGDGNDTITDTNGANRIAFGNDIAPSNVRVSQIGGCGSHPTHPAHHHALPV